MCDFIDEFDFKEGVTYLVKIFTPELQKFEAYKMTNKTIRLSEGNQSD